MNKELLRKVLIYAGIILFFAVVAYSFVPQVFSGKIVNQSDISAWRAMAQETIAHNEANPEDPTRWMNNMFGGMPVTMTMDKLEGDWTQKIYDFFMIGRRPASFLLLTMVGAFLLMLSMGINGIVAAAGAIAVAFCSYNLQIIEVGHNTKMQAIAFFPWVLAGVIFTYRTALGTIRKSEEKPETKDPAWKSWLPKTILGAVLFAVALSMQIKANHIQITYYLAIVIFIYAIALLASLCFDKQKRHLLGRFFAASSLLLVIGCIGIATNANKLIPTYRYAPFTMRGGSELSADSDSHNEKGLDLDYATAWSFGINETPNLLIPNFNGGASAGALSLDSETGKLLKRAGQPNLRETMKHMPLYWGPQPFTAGPMYMGAISIFLFVLGLFLVKGREKWWILAATVVAVLLSWGSHFMWFTKLWFDFAPFYNKFRTVSMSLIILQVTVPLLGFYALDRILKEKYTAREFFKAGLVAYLLTGMFCLVCAIFPGIAGSFTGAVDAGQPDVLVDALVADRQALLKKDAWHSFWLITIICALILWVYKTPKVDAVGKNGSFVRGARMAIVAVAVVFLVYLDLIPVGKRYLNKDHFVTPKDFSAQYEPRPVDNVILEDKDPHYRVLDLSVNTFNDAIPSYHHKTIGGYSAVKMQRYQDLIERYITSEIRQAFGVIGNAKTVQEVTDSLPFMKMTSALNGKYVIIGGEYPPVMNRHAYGNAWFVSSAVPAGSPDEEIGLLASTDLRSTAVIGKDFQWALDAVGRLSSGVGTAQEDASSPETAADPAGHDESAQGDYIKLSSYAPNEMHYDFKTTADRAVIFSEVYYPDGWKAWIEPAGSHGQVKNGKYHPGANAVPVELFRADWILRGAVLPEGEGQLVMRFEPSSYEIGEDISRASSITLILMLLGSVAMMFLSGRKQNQHGS